MKTENLEPATLEECNSVLAALPDLTADGFESYYRGKCKNSRRALEAFPPKARHQATPITDREVRNEIPRARLFLRENCLRTKTIRRKIGTSYGLKHEAERWFGAYISNGALIAAAYLEGYAIERDGPNAYFSMSLRREYRRLLHVGRPTAGVARLLAV